MTCSLLPPCPLSYTPATHPQHTRDPLRYCAVVLAGWPTCCSVTLRVIAIRSPTIHATDHCYPRCSLSARLIVAIRDADHCRPLCMYSLVVLLIVPSRSATVRPADHCCPSCSLSSRLLIVAIRVLTICATAGRCYPRFSPGLFIVAIRATSHCYALYIVLCISLPILWIIDTGAAHYLLG